MVKVVSSMAEENPYELLDLDPTLDLETLTEVLRERAEDLAHHFRLAVERHQDGDLRHRPVGGEVDRVLRDRDPAIGPRPPRDSFRKVRYAR